jgi:hypothetical protein
MSLLDAVEYSTCDPDRRIASQALKPDDCSVRCCITALAPCTNSLRTYWFPR